MVEHFYSVVYVCVDRFSTALLYKKMRFPVNAVNVNFMRGGGSTFCCCPLIATQRRRANLSTAGEARSSWPLTWAVGSATRCRKVLSLYSEFQITKFNRLRKKFCPSWAEFQKLLSDKLADISNPHFWPTWTEVGIAFFQINQLDKLEFAKLFFLYRIETNNCTANK